MDEPPPAIRRVCVSVDLTGADDVARLLGHADAPSGLRRDRWLTQATGAGEIALLPPGIDEGKVLPALVRVLRQAGSALDPGAHLRVAIHQGLTTVGPDGLGGEGVHTLGRLRALATAEHAAFTLVISASIFESLPGLGLSRSSFRRAVIDVPPTEAWILTVHHKVMK